MPRTESLAMPEAVPASGRVWTVYGYRHVNTVSLPCNSQICKKNQGVATVNSIKSTKALQQSNYKENQGNSQIYKKNTKALQQSNL